MENNRYFRYRIASEPCDRNAALIEQERQERYEESVVKFMLRRLDIEYLTSALWADEKGKNGVGRLTCACLHNWINVPMHLQTLHLKVRDQPTLDGLFDAHRNQAIVRHFLGVWTALENAGDWLHVGVVFPVRGSKFCAIHSVRGAIGEQRSLIRLRISEYGDWACIEPLAALLDRLPARDRWHWWPGEDANFHRVSRHA